MKSNSLFTFISVNGFFPVEFIRLAARSNLGESSTISLFSGVAKSIFTSSFFCSFRNGTLNLLFCFGFLADSSLLCSEQVGLSSSFLAFSSAENEVSIESLPCQLDESPLVLFNIPFLGKGGLIPFSLVLLSVNATGFGDRSLICDPLF